MNSLLSALSPEQQAVVTAPPGPLLCLAGAGSGKTRVLTHRAAWLLSQGGPDDGLLLMTFTAAAAAEMTRRVAALLGRAATSRVRAGTFHHIAHRLLCRHGSRMGLPPSPAILDRQDAQDLLRACLSDAARGEAGPWPRAEDLHAWLSLSVLGEQPLLQVVQRRAPALLGRLPALRRVCDDYARRKLRLQALDFDDLLLFLRLLLCDHRDVAEAVQAQFRHVLVDEYQDTSPLEAALCDQLAAGHHSLTVVGDDAQAIYGFRGGDLRNLLGFPGRWPGATVLRLRTNYRSTPEIVAAGCRAIAQNRAQFLKEMEASRPSLARPLERVFLPDGVAQAAYVAARVRALIDAGTPAADIAVLYRGHAHAAELQLALLRQRLPYRLHSGPRLIEEAHVKDALAFLRLCVAPGDEVGWERVLRQHPGLGPAWRRRLLEGVQRDPAMSPPYPLQPPVWSGAPRPVRAALERLAALLGGLWQAAKDGADPQDLLTHLIDKFYAERARRLFPDAEERLAELRQLGAQLRAHARALADTEGAAGLREVLAGLLLLRPASPGEVALADGATPADDRVLLSTVHKAKGLEWPVVFLLWLCEGHFPQLSALADIEEERRLFYVALTRARDTVVLCVPERGEGALRPSRFLREILAEGEGEIL